MTHKKLKILAWIVVLSFAAPPGFAQDVISDGQVPRAFEKAIKDFKDPFKEKITLDYKDADIATVLRSLSYTYGLNLVTSTEVKGKVTISLKDVALGEALEAILSANGYNYSIKGDIIYITPGTEEGAQLISEPISLKYLKAGDAQNLIRKVLSPKGDIKVDDVFNLLVVTDYPANVEKLKELLKSVDRAPQQVLIEAKIVDITSKDLQNLGLTWSVDYDPGKGIFGRKTAAVEKMQATGTMPGPSSSLSSGQIKVDTLILKALTASATLDALVQDQKANLLASPSIAVLNNREARIIIGEKVPYKERSQTTTGTTETTKFIDVGTTLRVTPSINADGYITMNIHPEVSSVSSILDAGPRITTREADTQVRIKEGETIVIGGLIKQEDNRTQSRMPLLGYIPVLGYLFGNKSKDKTQTELAVFITPKILRSHSEMLEEGKNPYQEEAYVNIMATGKLNAQMVLFEKARNLDTDTGLEARDKDEWMRKRQALSIYETIFTQFPDGPKAAESGYYAAKIYFGNLKETQRAKELCIQIISTYPNSEFFDKTKDLYRDINILTARGAFKRRQKEKEMQKAQEEIRLRAIQQAEGQAEKRQHLRC